MNMPTADLTLSTEPGAGQGPASHSTMSDISKTLIRQRFDKASQSYQAHNGVQQRIARTLIEMMTGQLGTDSVLLDLGCGPGPDWSELTRSCKQYIGVDLSSAMLTAHASTFSQSSTPAAWLLQADMESLPLVSASVDILYSSMAMQWAGNRQRLCDELTRVLKPDADAFISVPLHGSLQPLAQLRQAIDGQLQVNPQPDMQTWLDQWIASGWTIQASEQHCFTEYFADLKRLLLSIKGVGAGANQAVPLTRATLRKLAADYELRRTDRGLPLQYEVGLLHLKRT